MKQRPRLDTDNGWIQCYSGRPFWPLDPDQDDVDIIDIAWSLSMQCRYAGHSQRFYSVAEHCVHISNAVPPSFTYPGTNELWGLLHDAAEAYLVDLPRPAKQGMPEYRFYESQLEACIALAFGLILPIPRIVKEYDTRILLNERAVLFKHVIRDWSLTGDPVPNITIACWQPNEANARFLERYYQLRDKQS